MVMDSAKTKAQQGVNVNTTVIAPQDITSILLADGWHEIEQCQFTHFAVSPSASPPQPNSLYSAIEYVDKSSRKRLVSALSQVLGFERTA